MGSGLTQFAGALANFTIAPLAAWVVDETYGLRGDWTAVIVSWIPIAVALGGMVEWLARCG